MFPTCAEVPGLHIPRKPEHPKEGNGIPVKINFVPDQAMAG